MTQAFATLALIIALLLNPALVLAQSLMPQAADRAALEKAISNETPDFTPPAGVTGITVPHHLLAADLIARGFWAASSDRYERIILLAPDHFRLVQGAFAVMTDLPETVFGPVAVDTTSATTLLSDQAIFDVHPDPAQEHGVGALLPFVAHFFPDADVLAVVGNINSSQSDWDAATRALSNLITPETLVVQSTDFSHFLSVENATLHDRHVLATLLTGQAVEVARLLQPDHLDSKASQYLQMRLQAGLGAQPVVIANRNSVHYGTARAETTSYLVAVYHRDPSALSRLAYADQERLFFGGDVLTGRYLTNVLQDAGALAAILQTVQDTTRGAPLIVNLEGVIVDDPVINAPQSAHQMPAALTLPVLRNMHVVAAGLANNHTMDLGNDGHASTQAALEKAGITALPHGEIVDLGPLRVLALNFLTGKEPHISNAAELQKLCARAARSPVVVFAHWGKEYTSEPASDQREVADQIAACGASALIGGHSHRADPQLRHAAGSMLWTYSLGNLLFDQSERKATGQLAEVRVFQNGNIAMRLVPLPNLFALGTTALRADQ